MEKIRAVLQDHHGVVVQTLPVEAIPVYEARAAHGCLTRFLKLKKGRKCIVFRLPAPEIPPVAPSNSLDSKCAMTLRDMEGLAGARTVNWRDFERWVAWDLVAIGERRQRLA